MSAKSAAGSTKVVVSGPLGRAERVRLNMKQECRVLGMAQGLLLAPRNLQERRDGRRGHRRRVAALTGLRGRGNGHTTSEKHTNDEPAQAKHVNSLLEDWAAAVFCEALNS